MSLAALDVGSRARIYPIASAGGYQLLGRSLSTWQAWGKEHSLLNNFDQVEFYQVSEEELAKVGLKVLPRYVQLMTRLREHSKRGYGSRRGGKPRLK